MKWSIKEILWWTGGFIVFFGIIGFFIWEQGKPKPPEVGEAIAVDPVNGRQHISIGATHPLYGSNPPTSGPHYEEAAKWGIYQTELPDEQVLHNLEHGGIWISYTNIDADTKTKIENMARRYPNKMIVTPRAKNDSKIALASWSRLQKLEAFDETIIVNFIKSNKNQSPEPLAQ